MFMLAQLLIFTTFTTVYLSGAAQNYRSEAEKVAIIESATRSWNSVQRWLIEYDCLITPNPEGSHVRMIMAVGFPGDYYKFKAKGLPHIPWEADPFTEESFINNGVATVRFPLNRTFTETMLKPGAVIEGTISRDVLWRVMPVCPMNLYQLPMHGRTFSPILDRAWRSSAFRMLTGTEYVNGEECLMLVHNDSIMVVKTWVSIKGGLCLKREEVRDASSEELTQRLIVEEIRELAPGIRLPVRFRLERFGTDSGKPQERVLSVNIVKCLLNEEVPVTTFEARHSPGSLKELGGGGKVQVIPGGEDMLLNQVAFINRYTRPSKRHNSPSAVYWAVAGVACGFGVVGLLVGSKRSVC